VINHVLPRLMELDKERRPIVLPPDLDAWAGALAQEWITWADQAGIDVVGDLDELRPGTRTEDWEDPDDVKVRPLLRMMTHAVVAAVEAAAARPAPDARITARARRATKRLLRR
jgi:hypothetical protein